MKSIRRTLTVSLVISLGALMAMCGGVLYVAMRRALVGQFDDSLRAKADLLVSMLRWDGEKIDPEASNTSAAYSRTGDEAEFFDLRLAGGQEPGPLILRSSSLSGMEWPFAGEPGDGIVNEWLPDGRPGRVLTVRFRASIDEELDEAGKEEAREGAAANAPMLILRMGRSRVPLDRTIRLTATWIAMAGAATGMGLGGIVWLVVTRGLAPLSRLSAQVRDIHPERLEMRVASEGMPAELAPICDRLNDALERLEVAFARDRRFTAAAAHELRTPIAELRTLLEVVLRRPRGAEELRRSVEEASAITLRVDELVSSLMMLARYEPRRCSVPMEDVDVGRVLSEVADRHRGAARAGDGDIAIGFHGAEFVAANAAMLERVLDNIVANAVEYAAPRPMVSCSISDDADADEVVVEVRNPCAGLSAEDVKRFTEPFWRRTDSRSDHSHLGLGLSVAAMFAECMGGVLSAEIAAPDEVCVRLRLTKAGMRAGAARSARGVPTA